ncbi:PPE domain-containing protein [Actinosynnema sp. NPDC020468]|uniref:PPE domain-containing protein n=1 Tax=Actinosynnema sp. NPDC020468 TaxID=3154488 RepID=UPI0033C2125F
MPEHRWSGYSHEELYKQINSGPGPAASHASIERWEGISAALTEINADLHAGVLKSGAKWEGAAADQARKGINPLATWAEDARSGSELMRLSAEFQADHISKARADMPPPVKVTAENPGALVSGLTHLIGGQTDYEIQEKAHNAAEQRAREVMTTYASSTAANTASLGQFHQPPQLVINASNIVRNDTAGLSGVPGFGGTWGSSGWWGTGRPPAGGGMRTTPAAPKAVPTNGGSATAPAGSGSGSGGTTSGSGAGGTTRTNTGGGGGGAGGGSSTSGGLYGSGGVIGGRTSDQDKRKSGTTTAEQHGGSSATTGSGSDAAGGHAPKLAGTTSTSSAEFGALASAQHNSIGAGGSTGLLGGGGPASAAHGDNGDTVHKRSTALPAQQAFDPFGLGTGRAEEEEEQTHDAAEYLRETDDIYGVGGYSPAVIGEIATD